jgi:hypothetical protein
MSISTTTYFAEFLMKNRRGRIFALLLATIITLLLLSTLIITEYKKQGIRSSQLEIEKNRITQIDKQMTGLYTQAYAESDTSNFNTRSKILEQIKFLKDQRLDAEKSMDDINKNPDTQILIFTAITTAIIILIITFFTISLRSTTSPVARKAYDVFVEMKKGNNLGSIDFINWLTTNEIGDKSLSGVDISKAKILKAIYDISEPLKETRNDLLTLVVDYTNAKRSVDEIKNDRFSSMFNSFAESKERLKEETNRLNRQAIINLLLCFLIAFMIIALISYSSFFSQDYKDIKTWNDFVIKLTPKIISILSLLTIFLYFIRMYKTNIIDVKYYQNELTNIDLKFIAAQAATIDPEKETINKLINDFSNAERNQQISKDFTTSELERVKLENEINKDYLAKIGELLSVSKKD